MARKVLIEIRRGTESNLVAGTLADGEFGYTTDTKKLFIGYGGQNICIGAASSLGDMLKSIYDTNGNGIVDKAEDSNTVGGKSANAFAPSGFGLGTSGFRLASGYDLNTLKANGWYDVQSPTNGVAGLTWHNIHVYCSADAGYVTQMVFGMTENQGRVWIRALYNNSAWTNWRELLSNKRTVTWNDLMGV